MSEQLSSDLEGGSANALGDILGKILGSQAQGANQSVPETQQNSPVGSEPSGATPSTDIFSSLLSNPDLLLKLPAIISAAKPIIDMLSQMLPLAQGNDPPSVSTGSVSTAKSAPTSHHGADHRAALLCAMKPYLSNDRQRMVDYIVKLGKLGDILKTL